MADHALFDFTVPDELLKEAVGHSRDREAVADLELVPGTGEGKPPSMLGVLGRYGVAPLGLLTAASLVTGTFGNGISLLGPDIQRSFHLNDAGLGALTFAAAVAQIGWGMPVAVAADRGSRKVVAAVTLLIFAALAPLMAITRNVWPFVFIYIVAAIGYNSSDTVHNSYLSDAYPTQARARVFAYHSGADPVSQTFGIWIVGVVAATFGSWRWAMLLGALGIPVGLAILRLREPPRGANESSHILKASGMDLASQQESAPRVLLGSAIQRLLRIRSLYYELIAVAILGFAGTGIPLFGPVTASF